MTRNVIRRDHDDPMWSGLLVEGADRGWEYDECTLSHLGRHLQEASKLVSDLAVSEYHDEHYDLHGVIHVERSEDLTGRAFSYTKMAQLFEAVDNLQRYLPWVEGWCVVQYHQIQGERVADVRTAHLSRAHAEEWLAAWNPEKGGVERMSAVKRFGIEWLPAPILAFVHPECPPGRALP